MLKNQLEALFNYYHKAFKRQNISDVLNCYHFPCTLVTPDRLVLLKNVKEAAQEFDQIFTSINDLDIHTFKALDSSFEHICDSIIAVNIHWQFFNTRNDIIADFFALYHILKNEQKLKIFQVISHEVESSISLPFPLNLTEIEA